MKERRFVGLRSGTPRLGDNVRRNLRSAVDQSPTAIEKVRAKRAKLEMQVARGEISRERANCDYLKFASLIVAHIREHGPENAPLDWRDELRLWRVEPPWSP